MGQVELQPEPVLPEGNNPSKADFSSENYSFFNNSEVNSSDITPILNAESIVVLEGKGEEYKGWIPDEGISFSNTQPESRFKRALRKIAVPAGGAIAAVLVACGGGSEGDSDEVATTAPTQTEATATQTIVESTPTETATPTVEPTQDPNVEQTPNIGKGSGEEETPEVVVETPCQILPEEICKQAEVINYKAEGNEDTIILGFKDIPEGTPVITPVTGGVISVDYGNGTPGGWKGKGVIIDLTPDGTKMVLVIGDLNLDSVGLGAKNTGEQVASVGASGVDNFGYKLLVQFIIQEGEKFKDNDEAYNLYFPEVIKKEPVGEITRTQTQVTFAGYHFVE